LGLGGLAQKKKKHGRTEVREPRGRGIEDTDNKTTKEGNKPVIQRKTRELTPTLGPNDGKRGWGGGVCDEEKNPRKKWGPKGSICGGCLPRGYKGTFVGSKGGKPNSRRQV